MKVLVPAGDAKPLAINQHDELVQESGNQGQQADPRVDVQDAEEVQGDGQREQGVPEGANQPRRSTAVTR